MLTSLFIGVGKLPLQLRWSWNENVAISIILLPPRRAGPSWICVSYTGPWEGCLKNCYPLEILKQVIPYPTTPCPKSLWEVIEAAGAAWGIGGWWVRLS